jgi:hypothetical protein
VLHCEAVTVLNFALKHFAPAVDFSKILFGELYLLMFDLTSFQFPSSRTAGRHVKGSAAREG